MEYVTITIPGALEALHGRRTLRLEPRFTEWLVEAAVHRLPEAPRDRYREEWLAHLEQKPGQIFHLLPEQGL